LSDSSGRIWFRTLDENRFGTTGTAWFDPATGNGCKFTNSTGNIIEDSSGYLWLFDPPTRTLYRSADSVVTRDNLTLTPVCSINPDTTRIWRVRNTNPDPVSFTWEVVGTGQTGSGTVPGSTAAIPGEITFETQTVPDSPNTVRILVNGTEQNQQDSISDYCPQPPIARAGDDQIVHTNTETAITILDGSASDDIADNGTIISYEWTNNGAVIATEANPSPYLLACIRSR